MCPPACDASASPRKLYGIEEICAHASARILSFSGVLIILYSYVCLDDTAEALSNEELTLAFWFGVMVVEEIRQMFENGVTKLAVTEWWKDLYNKMDLAMYLMYYLSLGIRTYDFNNASFQRVAKGLMGINVMQVYIRSMNFFKRYPGLGPKLVIFENLFGELLQFVILLAIFIFSYGIFVQTIVYPFDDFASGKLWRVWYKPYFQIYGELMLDDLAEDSSCISSKNPWQNCAYAMDWLVPVITGVYLLVTSIMLLNMLIAAFTTTYERIEAKADRVHKMNMLDLATGYAKRTLLPVPFNFFNIVWELIKVARQVLKCGSATSGHEKQVMDEFKQKVCLGRKYSTVAVFVS